MTPISEASVLVEDGVVELQSYLQERLDEHFGRRRAIQAFDRQLCPYMSSFRIDELDVWLEDGSRVRLMLKDMSRASMLEEARRARPAFIYEPGREIDAYRRILPCAPPGTAALYGALTHPSADRYWLLLEQVSGLPLWQVGDVSIWGQAAAWIARFHESFSPLEARRLARRVGALEYDEAYYWRWMYRAQQFANGDSSKRRVLNGVERGYARVVARLLRSVQTLIHGEFYASNLIVRKRARVRMCPLDWEMAAIGPPLIDLAALTAGWAESTQRTLARAYVASAASGKGTLAPHPPRLSRDFMRDLDCCRLHLAVRMLGWSSNWEPPRDHAQNWLLEAERISRRLQH
jgi:Phosphotransferase enzyme family